MALLLLSELGTADGLLLVPDTPLALLLLLLPSPPPPTKPLLSRTALAPTAVPVFTIDCEVLERLVIPEMILLLENSLSSPILLPLLLFLLLVIPPLPWFGLSH